MAVALDVATVHRLDRVLVVDHADAPLAEAATRRLGVQSWMLTFDAEGRLRAATVLGDEPALRLPAAPAAPPPPPAHPLDRVYPLPPDGALARVVGSGSATGRQLADLALRRDDPELRADAVRAVVDAALRDPSLERTLLEAIAGADDGALAGALTGISGDAADGLVTLIVDRAHGRPLAERAERVLRHLRAR